MGRDRTLNVQKIITTDILEIADISDNRVFLKVERQVDEIFRLGKSSVICSFVKLNFFISPKAIHAFGKVVDFIGIYERVFKEGEFSWFYNFLHKKIRRIAIMGKL